MAERRRRSVATVPGAPVWYSWVCAVSSRKASSSELLCGLSSCSTRPRRAASSPISSVVLPATSIASGTDRRHLGTLLLERLGQAPHLRAADADPVPGRLRHELRRRPVEQQPALADHDEVVGHQLHLAEQVAGHEDRPAVGGEAASGSRGASGRPRGRVRSPARRTAAWPGSPRSEPARPSRCRMPRENCPTRRLAASPRGRRARAPRRPARLGMRFDAASAQRWS